MDKNLREFTSPLQKTVWRSFIVIFHPAYSTAQVEDGEYKQSCMELYTYTTDGMIDFAEHPEAYDYIPSERLICYEVYGFHHTFIETLLSYACIREKDCILIDNSVYDSILERFENKLKKNKILDRSFTVKELLKTLDRRGICIERGETQVSITNSRYPNMFYAASLLEETAAAYYQRTKRTPQQYRLLDFLSVGNDKRKFTFDDIIAPMYDDEKELLHRFIGEVKKKIKLSQSCRIWYFRSADFSYKRKSLFHIWWGKSYAFELGIQLPAPDTAAYDYLLGEISKQPDAEEFKAFCHAHIKICRYCNVNCIRTNSYKKNWILFDRPMKKLIRSCEQQITVYEFTKQHYSYYIRLTDIIIQMIDRGML